MQLYLIYHTRFIARKKKMVFWPHDKTEKIHLFLLSVFELPGFRALSLVIIPTYSMHIIPTNYLIKQVFDPPVPHAHGFQ